MEIIIKDLFNQNSIYNILSGEIIAKEIENKIINENPNEKIILNFKNFKISSSKPFIGLLNRLKNNGYNKDFINNIILIGLSPFMKKIYKDMIGIIYET